MAVAQINKYILKIHNNSMLFEELISNTKVVNGCWEWQKSCYWDGYGMKGFRVKGKQYIRRTHRLIDEILNGPTKLHICHKCDNPKCINPAHLFRGTMSDNMRDMFAKGRGKDRDYARGESGGLSKLTDKKVYKIKLMLRAGILGSVIAKKYKMGPTAISSIKNGHTWKHVVLD